MLKRVVLLLICLFFFGLPWVMSVRAVDGPVSGVDGEGVGVDFSSGLKEIRDYEDAVLYSNTTGQNTLENFQGNNLLGITFRGLYCELAGCQRIGKVGAIHSAGKAIAYLYASPAASSQVYIADVMNSAGVGFGVAQPAYAQGLGFGALNPILETWKIFRNLAYILYVIMFLVVGFMIMFRQKVGSQAVVTAQQALPQVIVSMVAVTFSYAIAGLLIDVMYLVMFLLVNIFNKQESNWLLGANIFQLGVQLVGGEAKNAAITISGFVNQSVGGEFFGPIAGLLGGVIGAIIIATAVIIALFRLFVELIKTYVSIILTIALAPIALVMGAIPGTDAFTPWLKSLIGDLAAFPTVLFMLIIYDQLTGGLTGGTGIPQVAGGFLPPYISGAGSSASVAGFVVGVGGILILTELVQQVKKSISGGSAGVLQQLGEQVFKNAARGEIGLPVVGAMGGGALGLAKAGQAILTEDIQRGTSIRDVLLTGKGTSMKNAGLFGGMRQGFAGGNFIRKYVERGREGRLFQVENVETQLADILKRNKGEQHKEPTPNDPPISKP